MELETLHSQTFGKLFEALSKAQGKIQHALKDKKNPFFKSSYADLTSVWEACKAPLSENGLAIIQTVEGTKESMYLCTWLGHSSGEWIKSKLPLMNVKLDPQSVGSAITYARRYALSAIVGICADEDDDGEKAMNRDKKNTEKVVNLDDPNDEKALDEFCKWFPSENPESIKAYIRISCAKQKAAISTALDYYSRKDVFVEDFGRWKIKNKEKITA